MPRRRLLVSLVSVPIVVIVLAGVVVALAAQKGEPTLTLRRLLPASVTFPGPVPTLAWPAQGQAAVAVDGLGGLGTSGAATPVPIASVAKVMTAYVVLTDHPLPATGAGGFSVTIDAAQAADQDAREAQGQSTLPVEAGETLDEDQLLQGLLLPSGNNIAAILATIDAGGEAAFVAKMNATAKTLGMDSTTYTDSSGFTATTVSTAVDQLTLAGAAMAIPEFARVVALPQVTLPVAGVVKNFNTLVGTDGFIGIKTGSDSEAGGCLVFADQRVVDGVGVRIVGAVLGQDVGTVSTPTIVGAALAASQRLADSVTTSLSVRAVLPAGDRVARVTNPDGRTVDVTTAAALSHLGYGGERLALSVSESSLGARLRAGQEVGSVQLGTQGPATPAVARATMPGVSWSWRLHHVL